MVRPNTKPCIGTLEFALRLRRDDVTEGVAFPLSFEVVAVPSNTGGSPADSNAADEATAEFEFRFDVEAEADAAAGGLDAVDEAETEAAGGRLLAAAATEAARGRFEAAEFERRLDVAEADAADGLFNGIRSPNSSVSLSSEDSSLLCSSKISQRDRDSNLVHTAVKFCTSVASCAPEIGSSSSRGRPMTRRMFSNCCRR